MLNDTVVEFITKHNLINSGDTIIVGFSGGPDSLFLLHILAELRGSKNTNLIAAHLDHEWRSTSAQEALFCKSVAEELGIPFVAARMSELTFNKKSSGSLEELGRRARRFFLEHVRTQYNAHSIALAHHLDDQEETFLIRLIRGTTIAGLRCMKPRDAYYVRPLLDIQKKDILAYLQKNNMPYIIDPSNMSEQFLRTRIRKHVLPALRQCDNRFDNNFQRTVYQIQQADAFIERLTKDTFSTLATEQDQVWHLDLISFFSLDLFLQQRILLYWFIRSKVSFIPTQSFLNEVMRFLKKRGTKAHTMHTTWKIVKTNTIAYIKSILAQ